jgi:hypothetical protein
MIVDRSSQATGRRILGALAFGLGCGLLIFAAVLLGFSCSPANTADGPALLSGGLRISVLGGRSWRLATPCVSTGGVEA